MPPKPEPAKCIGGDIEKGAHTQHTKLNLTQHMV